MGMKLSSQIIIWHTGNQAAEQLSRALMNTRKEMYSLPCKMFYAARKAEFVCLLVATQNLQFQVNMKDYFLKRKWEIIVKYNVILTDKWKESPIGLIL